MRDQVVHVYKHIIYNRIEIQPICWWSSDKWDLINDKSLSLLKYKKDVKIIGKPNNNQQVATDALTELPNYTTILVRNTFFSKFSGQQLSVIDRFKKLRDRDKEDVFLILRE